MTMTRQSSRYALRQEIQKRRGSLWDHLVHTRDGSDIPFMTYLNYYSRGRGRYTAQGDRPDESKENHSVSQTESTP